MLRWAWSSEATRIERFIATRKIALVILDLGMRMAATYQACLKVLRARTTVLTAALVVTLWRRVKDEILFGDVGHLYFLGGN